MPRSAEAGRPRARAASIRDVARSAGVSHQTVSRVINNHPNVSADTRARVDAAVESLRFRPNRAARALASGAAATVTVLTSETSLYGYAETIRGIEGAARAVNVGVGITVIASADRRSVAAAAQHVSDPRGGAVIVVAFDTAGARALAALPPEVTFSAAVEPALGRRSAGASPAVWFDEAAAARQATEHLLGLGHRSVHHIAIPSTRRVGDRQRGWAAALAAAGVAVPAPVRAAGWGIGPGYAAATQLLADPGVTAIFCGNDDIALGCLRAATEAGRRVPGDLSVVGFDDIPVAGFLVPSLTTVRLDFVALGRRAFELLGLGAPSTPVPPPQLVVRESSGRPARVRRRG